MPETIKDLHSRGMTNREIGKVIGVHHSTVTNRMKKIGLKPHKGRRTPIKMVGTDKAECSKCHKVKDIEQFLKNQYPNRPAYRLTYCHSCRNIQALESRRRNIETFLRDRLNRLKRKCEVCDLDLEYLVSLYNKQKGLCFYTDIRMIWNGKGLSPNSMSIDKIIPEKGYIRDNVVFCINRVNTMKSNVSLKEMKEWMPGWHQRIVQMWRDNGVACFQVADGDF